MDKVIDKLSAAYALGRLTKPGDAVEVLLSSGVASAVLEALNPKRPKVRLLDGNVISVRPRQLLVSQLEALA